ncbi:MAG: ATP-binding protein [Candidatus Diapherotrites archaeon]
MNLDTLFGQEESDSLEKKTSISDLSSIGHTACAFANQSIGGYFLIGLDKNGAVVGVPKSKLDEWSQKIANVIQSCRPTPKIDFETLEREGKNVLAVHILPLGEEHACFYQGKVYLRVGSSTRVLNESELIEFLRQRQILSFEDTASNGQFDDLSMAKVKTYLKLRDEKISLDEKTALQNMGLLKGASKSIPTNLALLFFANNIQEQVPQAEIRLTRFDGIEPIHIANSQRLNTTILDAIDQTISFLTTNTGKRLLIEGTKRKDVPEYPPEVIREAVTNAIGHRDYFNQNATHVNIFDDRVEITNPGPLPNGLLFSELGKISVHRNPRLYQLLSHVGYGEGLGTGIPRMIEKMRLSKLPDPNFEEIGNFFRVTLFNRKSQRKIKQLQLSMHEEQVLKIVRDSKSAKAQLLAKKLGVSLPTILKFLKELEKRGLVKKIGKTRGAYYVPKDQT